MSAEIISNFSSSAHEEDYFLDLDTLDNAGGLASMSSTSGS